MRTYLDVAKVRPDCQCKGDYPERNSIAERPELRYMEDSASPLISNTIKYELLLIVIFNAVMLLAFSNINYLELLNDFSLQHKYFELDAIVPTLFTMSLSLGLFSLRRWREGKVLLAKMQLIATHDHLTGAFNRRYIQDVLLTELERFKRTNSTFSIMMIDIDDFKQVNDAHGHNAGDKVLSQFSTILSDSTRAIDIVSRWGGEEFLILCPATDIDGVTKLGRKLLKAIRQFKFDKPNNVTACLGIASSKKSDDSESIIRRADVRLYKAKSIGKNCFIAAT